MMEVPMSEARAVRPEDVLPDEVDVGTMNGVSVRKGTIGAFVANVKLLDALDPTDPGYQEVVDQLRALVPAVRAVGVFDVLAPRSPVLAKIIAES
jgi:hypothetical protein